MKNPYSKKQKNEILKKVEHRMHQGFQNKVHNKESVDADADLKKELENL